MTWERTINQNIMEEKNDIKTLIDEAKKQINLEIRYKKLTAVENISIFLSRIAFICVMSIVGVFAMFYILSTIYDLLQSATGHPWVANIILVAFLLLIMLLIYAFRKPLIIDPITRFVSKMFLNPKDYEHRK